MTFRDFMARRRASHDARGDFVRLALADADFPNATEWQVLRHYFLQRHGNADIADVGGDVWKEFKVHERRDRRDRLRQARDT